MTSKQLEIQVQTIETPEELISKLKEKSKDTLAKKVEDVVKWIEWGSKNKWEKLKTELTPVEKAEIKETFQNSWVDIKLDELEKKSWTAKKVETALKVGWVWAVAWVVAMEASNELSGIKDAKWLGFFDKILWSFNKIWDWFGSITDWIKSWFASSFPSLAKWFGIEWNNLNTWDKKGENWIWMAEKWKENVEATPEWKINHKYIIVTKIFSKMFWKQFNKNSSKEMNQLFSTTEFWNKKYSEIRPIYNEYVNKKDKKWLAEKLKITWFKDEDVFIALATIVSANSHWNKLILNIYKHKKEDIENKTIEKIMTWLYTDLHLIENFEAIEGPDDFVSWKVASIFDLHAEKNENWEINIAWWLSDKAQGLWLSRNLIFFWYTRDITMDKFSKDPNFINSISPSQLAEKDRKILVEKIIPFWLKIGETINSKFNLWLDLKSYFNNNSLTLSQIISLYTITWWETDYDKMNSLEKTYLFAKIPWIIADKDPETSAKYVSRVFDKIESNVDIPEDVKLVLLNIWNTLKDSAIDWLKYTWSWLWWFAQESPFTTAFIALMLYFLPLKAKRISMHSSLKSLRK